ncbi:MAG: hypothetical protein WD768_07680 [Phycisphaeraceae bacterium]
MLPPGRARLIALIVLALTSPALVAQGQAAEEGKSHFSVRPGPSDRTLGDLLGKLQIKVSLTKSDKPLGEVLAPMLRQAGVSFMINNDALEAAGAGVALSAEGISLRQALNLVCRNSSGLEPLEWDVIDDSIVISTRRDLFPRMMSVRSYDIRPMLVQRPNWVEAPALSLSEVLGTRWSYSSATTLFADDASDISVTTRGEMIEQITTMIQDTVGVTSEWAAYGGEWNSLREKDGRLIIKTYRKNHEHIAHLLAGMLADDDDELELEARCLVVKTKVLDQIRKDLGGSLKLDRKQADEFLKRISADEATKPISITRTFATSGQRVHAVVMREKVVMTGGQTSDAGGTSQDTTTQVLAGGMVFDIEPTLDKARGRIIMTLRLDAAPEMKSRERSLVLRSKPQPKFTPAPPDTAAPPAVAPPKPKPVGDPVTVDLPEQDTIQLRLNVTIPEGGAAVMSAGSNLLQAADADSEVIIIVRAAIASVAGK